MEEEYDKVENKNADSEYLSILCRNIQVRLLGTQNGRRKEIEILQTLVCIYCVIF